MKAGSVIKIHRALSFCLGLVFVCSTSLIAPVFAQGQQEMLLKMTFDAKDYQATARLANDMIRRQPSNGYAHYYLGYSLVRSGRIGAGRYELTKCHTLSRGTELGKLADQALAEILPYDASVDTNRVEPKLPVARSQERQRLLSEQEKEMQEVQSKFNDRVNQLQKSSTPAELKIATQKEFEQLSKDQAAITERYQRRADALLRRGSATSPTLPMNPSRGVQNFEHAQDPSRAATIPSENPMHASALKLGSGAGKGSAVKPGANSKTVGK